MKTLSNIFQGVRAVLAGVYQLGLFLIGCALWACKMAVYIWSGAFLVIVGGLAFVTAFYMTVCAFALAMYAVRLFSGV